MARVGAAQIITDGQDWNGCPEWQGTSETVTYKYLPIDQVCIINISEIQNTYYTDKHWI
jgi:hypothetical protein